MILFLKSVHSFSYLSCQWQQNFIGEHFEVGVFPQGSPVDVVIDNCVMNNSTPLVPKSLGDFLQHLQEIDAGEGSKILLDLWFCGWTRQSFLPGLRVLFWAVTVLVIHGPWGGDTHTQCHPKLTKRSEHWRQLGLKTPTEVKLSQTRE